MSYRWLRPLLLGLSASLGLVWFSLLGLGVGGAAPDLTATPTRELPTTPGQYLSFGQGSYVQVVDPDGRRSVDYFVSLPRLDVPFTLHQLPLERFRAVYETTDPWRFLEVDTTGLTQVAAWTESVNVNDYRARTRLPDSVTPGLYVLSMGNNLVGRAQLIIVVSRYVLLLKGGDNQVGAWVMRLQGGVPPTAGAIVELVSGNATVATLTTDPTGWAKGNVVWTDKMLAIARVGSEMTLAGFRYEWRADWGRWWGAGDNEYYTRHAYIYTDRPIYRPDQDVFFKAILRQDNDGDYAIPAPADPVTATLKDPRSNVVATRRLTLGEFGSVDGAFKLAAETSLGTYQLEIGHRGQTYKGSFEVQAYRKPEFEVIVTAAPDPVILGDKLDVTVDARYYFNAPVPNAPLTIKVLRTSFWWWWGGEQTIATVNAVTDAQGRWTGQLPTEGGGEWDGRLTVQAEVTDATAQVVTGKTSVEGYWTSLTLSSEQSRWSYRPGETISVKFTARDRQGAPLAGQPLEVTTTRYYSSTPTTATRPLTTGADGTATFSLDNAEQGWYNVEAKTRDNRGRTAQAWGYFWVFDPGLSGGWYVQDEAIEVKADKTAYRPGDTAQLLVRSPVRGMALLTLERGTVRREQVVELTGAATLVQVPLLDSDAPTVYAKVHIWKPYGNADTQNWTATPEGRLLMSNPLELPVAAEAKRLKVDITADKAEYRPGETATITLNIRNASGQGQRAEVSLALVDEAIFALAADNVPDPFDYFYGKREHSVGTWDSLRPYRYPNYRDIFAPAPQPTGTPAPAGPPVAAPERPGGQPVRQTFRDTAYWNARVVTNAQGQATVSVPLPDNLTRWRIIARAVTIDTLAGMGQSAITVTKPVAVQPALPRFLIQGDRVSLDALVNNRTNTPLNTTVSMTGTGLLMLDGLTRNLAIPAGGQAGARWSAVASRVGTNLVQCEADAGALGDAVATPLPIHPFAIPERQAQAGQVENAVNLSFDVPLNAVSEASVAELRLSPSIALSLLDGLDDLVGYPYGCVEQVMSRVLPNAAVAQTYRRLGISNPDLERRLPDIMADGLQRLYGFQRPDGGWGWWYDDESAVYQTTYVLFGLLQIKAAGFDVDPNVLQRGLDWLENAIQLPPNATPVPGATVEPTRTPVPRPTATPTFNSDLGLDPRLRAYALYVLALGNRFHLDQATIIFAMNNLHDPFTYAALALTFHLGGDQATANEAANTLGVLAVETGNTVHWRAPQNEPYAWRTMQSDEKTTGLALRALSVVQPTSRLLPGAARWLMDRREGRGWPTTQASAFAILGLTDYILVSGELEADYDWRVTRDGVVLAQGHVSRANATSPIPPILVRGNDLRPGQNTLQIEKTGPGRLYYSLAVRLSLFYPQFEAVSSAGTGIGMKRTYHLSEPGPGQAPATPLPVTATPTPGPGTAIPPRPITPTPTSPAQSEFRLGDVVEVKLWVELSEDMHYVLIEDRLPAGFEPLSERMNPFYYAPWDFWRPVPFWREYGYNRKELRDDRVTFFTTWLSAGRHEFTYRMRATRPGLFSALPAEAYPMYRPDIWGRSASQQLTVERAAFVDPTPMAVDVDRSCAVDEFDVRQMVHAWTTGRGQQTAVFSGQWSVVSGQSPVVNQQVAVGGRRSAVGLEDVARTLANVGRTCLNGEVQPGAPLSMTPRLRLLPRVGSVTIGQPFEALLALDGANTSRGYEVTLAIPQDRVRFDSVEVLTGGVALGPVSDDRQGLITFGSVMVPTSLEDGRFLALIRLTALQTGTIDLSLRDGQVLDANGHSHPAPGDGGRVIAGGYRLLLPSILQSQPIK